jgi:hypothetical protein
LADTKDSFTYASQLASGTAVLDLRDKSHRQVLALWLPEDGRWDAENPRFQRLAFLAFHPPWPDATIASQNVVLARQQRGDPLTAEIYLMHNDGTNVSRLTSDGGYDGGADLFADSRITFASDRTCNDDNADRLPTPLGSREFA